MAGSIGKHSAPFSCEPKKIKRKAGPGSGVCVCVCVVILKLAKEQMKYDSMCVHLKNIQDATINCSDIYPEVSNI